MDFERDAKAKMGKGIYSARKLKAGTAIGREDICLKSPANGIPAYLFESLIGKKLQRDVEEETPISPDMMA